MSDQSIRLFEAYWNGSPSETARGGSWRDDKHFADRLDEMVNEMQEAFPKHISGIKFEDLHKVADSIRERE